MSLGYFLRIQGDDNWLICLVLYHFSKIFLGEIMNRFLCMPSITTRQLIGLLIQGHQGIMKALDPDLDLLEGEVGRDLHGTADRKANLGKKGWQFQPIP